MVQLWLVYHRELLVFETFFKSIESFISTQPQFFVHDSTSAAMVPLKIGKLFKYGLVIKKHGFYTQHQA